MFEATVIIGNTVEIPYDPSEENSTTRCLRQPPNQPGTNLPYDSVKGKTGGSNVIMVYSNKKAYPSYLITYKWLLKIKDFKFIKK